MVGASSVASGEIRKSRKICPTRSEETRRSRADWPTSVLNISARLEPSQSRDASPEAFRNGRIASERAGGAVAVFSPEFPNSRPRKMKAAEARKITAELAPTIIHFFGRAAQGW